MSLTGSAIRSTGESSCRTKKFIFQISSISTQMSCSLPAVHWRIASVYLIIICTPPTSNGCRFTWTIRPITCCSNGCRFCKSICSTKRFTPVPSGYLVRVIPNSAILSVSVKLQGSMYLSACIKADTTLSGLQLVCRCFSEVCLRIISISHPYHNQDTLSYPLWFFCHT